MAASWGLALGVPAATSLALAVGGIYAAMPVYHAICLSALLVDRRRWSARLARSPWVWRWTWISVALVLGGLGMSTLPPRPAEVEGIFRDLLFGGGGLRFGFFAAYSMTVHWPVEEIFWRGVVDPRSAGANVVGFYLQHALPLAVFLGSPLEGVVLAVPAGAAGAYWSYTTRRSGSLVPVPLSHAAADAGILVLAWVLVK